MTLWAAFAAVALLAANGVFVAAEFALLSARRSRLEQMAADGDRRAKHAIAGVRELSLMLAGAQLGITMASLGLGAVAEPALAGVLESLLHLTPVPEAGIHAIAFTIALSIVVFLHMVVGEMAPKSWAITDPERSALVLARPFRAFVLLFRPAIRALNAMANGLVRLFGVEPQDELARVHRPGDLLLLVEESARGGTLAREHGGLLSRALEVSGLDAEATMVPRRDIVAIPAEASLAEVEQTATETGRSRLVVYEGDLDRVRGILHVKDLLRLQPDTAPTMRAGDLARPAFITVESRPIEDLMVDMRDARAHVAIVIDEYGSVSGLVALEDLIEELIGDFEDESDVRGGGADPSVHREPDGAFRVPGSLRPDELHDRTGISLPEGDYETVAGYVISVLERVPDRGDTVDRDGLLFEVTIMDGPRVVELRIRGRS